MTRKQFVLDAYNNGEIGQGVFGQFAVHNFDDKNAKEEYLGILQDFFKKLREKWE